MGCGGECDGKGGRCVFRVAFVGVCFLLVVVLVRWLRERRGGEGGGERERDACVESGEFFRGRPFRKGMSDLCECTEQHESTRASK